jgi:hypothetical protein
MLWEVLGLRWVEDDDVVHRYSMWYCSQMSCNVIIVTFCSCCMVCKERKLFTKGDGAAIVSLLESTSEVDDIRVSTMIDITSHLTTY